MHQSLLKYPLKSHRKVVTLPQESGQLAELIGIIYGDGSIGNSWQVIISLNSITYAEYAKYIQSLMLSLFELEARLRKRPNQNTLVVVLTSTTAVDFLVEKGAVRGNKLINTEGIPSWILANQDYERFFVRGIVDTDGCLYFHTHFVNGKKYVNIGLCFTNYSPKLILEISSILESFQIRAHITDRGRRIYLYRKKDIEKYLEEFGTSNARIIRKYKEWRSRIVVYSTRLESAQAKAYAGSNPASSALEQEKSDTKKKEQ